MNCKLIFVMLTFICSSCYKDYNPKHEDQYFLNGGIATGYSPFLRLYKTSFASIVGLNFNEYEVIVTDQNGVTETMNNGYFFRIRGIAGKEYTIKWKLKTEQNWHQFKKTIPKDNIDFVSLKKTNNNINVTLKEKDSVFYFLTMSNGIAKNKEIDHFLLKQNTDLKIWPLTKFKYTVSPFNVRFNINEQYTCDPYIWKRYTNVGLSYSMNLKLVSMSETDKINYITENESNFNKEEPLFDNKPFIYDYKKNNQYALVYFYNEYKDFDFNNYIDTLTGLVRCNIIQNNLPINPNKTKVGGVAIKKINDITSGFPVVDFIYSNSANRLFFKDYIDYIYVSNLFALNGECATKLENYNLIISVTYDDLATKKRFYYNTPFLYDGKTSQTITINLP